MSEGGTAPSGGPDAREDGEDAGQEKAMRGTGNFFKNGIIAVMLTYGSSVAFASGDHDGGHGDAGDGHGRTDLAFGSAAPAAESNRTIEIVARDTMRFEPSRITVAAGEAVTFRVRNAGRLQHSFTLGSHVYHQRHDREMMDMPANELAHHMDDSPNGMVVQPGQTGTLTWRFSRGGAIEFACHIPGHYPAGMKGKLEIE